MNLAIAFPKTRNSYRAMLKRCYYRKHHNYPRYGGRGITVCPQWKRSFKNFLHDMGPKPEGRSIDRIDNEGIYEPQNCRWATPKQQSANTRSQAKQQQLADIAAQFDLSTNALKTRLKTMNITQALTHNRTLAHGQYRSISTWAKLSGIPLNTLYKRIVILQWNPEKAIPRESVKF